MTTFYIKSHNVRLKYQNHKNECIICLIHWQSNVELQNVGTTQLTILNITHFQLEFQIIESPLIKYSTHHYILQDEWNE